MKIIKNEKGYALIFAILMLALFSILSVGIMATVSANNNIGRNERGLQSAYYISEAGIKAANNEFMEKLVDIHKTSNDADDFFGLISSYLNSEYSGGNYKTVSGFDSAYSSNPVAEVIIKEGTRTGDTTEYEVLSKGILDGATRITTMKFSLKWALGGNPDFTVYTTNGIEINQGGRIEGPIGTIATASDAIKISGGPTLKDVYVPDITTGITKPETFSNMGEVKQIGEITYEAPTFPTLPPLPEFYEDTSIYNSDSPANPVYVVKDGKVDITHHKSKGYTLQLYNDEYYIKELNISSGNVLNIDLRGGDKTLYIDEINTTSGDIINIIGDGKLTIYVKNKMNIVGSTKINLPNAGRTEKETIEKLAIYYGGETPLTLEGDGRTYASLFVKQADVILKQGGGLVGHLISLGENIAINGGTALMKGIIFAPNAHINMYEGPNIKAPIMAKTVTITGGAELSYNPDDLDYEMPINPFDPVLKTDVNKLLEKQTPIREK